MKEQWKKISGYENYSVSNLGRIRNDKTGLMQNQYLSNKYFLVCLSQGRKWKMFRAHRLVAMAFVPNPENKPCINHKNLNKTDNRVENLEWCTQNHNMSHAYRNGVKFGFQKNHKFGVGSKHGNAKLIEEQVLEIRKLYATGNYILKELGKEFDVSQTQICDIVNNKRWKHI